MWTEFWEKKLNLKRKKWKNLKDHLQLPDLKNLKNSLTLQDKLKGKKKSSLLLSKNQVDPQNLLLKMKNTVEKSKNLRRKLKKKPLFRKKKKEKSQKEKESIWENWTKRRKEVKVRQRRSSQVEDNSQIKN